MSLKPAREIDPNAHPAAPSGDWTAKPCLAGFAVYDDPRIAAATALAAGASRLIFTGAGAGYGIAAFGATAFAESGFDTRAIHAGDLAVSSGQFWPGDVLISVDSNSLAVASALRRAHQAGIQTVGITTRDLTIINPDILAQIPGFDDPFQAMDSQASLACSLGLALIAARLAPGTALAGEVARVERAISTIDGKLGCLYAALSDPEATSGRLVLAGQGSSFWAVISLVRQINAAPFPGRFTAAIAIHSREIDEDHVRLSHDDILIEIDTDNEFTANRSKDHLALQVSRPQRTWTLTRRATRSPQAVHLAGSSGAVASLVAFSTLAHLFEEILSNAPHPA